MFNKFNKLICFFFLYRQHSLTFIVGLFCKKKSEQLKVVNYFLQKSSTIDFWLGSNYGYCRDTVKKVLVLKISPKLCKTFCVFILIMQVFDTGWLHHWKWLVPFMRVVLEFFSNGKGLKCFLWHVLPKLSKITVTCPKVSKKISTLQTSNLDTR